MKNLLTSLLGIEEKTGDFQECTYDKTRWEGDPIFEIGGKFCIKDNLVRLTLKEVSALISVSEVDIKNALKAGDIDASSKQAGARTDRLFNSWQIWQARQHFSAYPKLDRVAGEVGRVMAVLGPKGGAGKTTLTTTSGVYAAKMGFKVVLVDFDPQGSTTEQTFGEGEELLYDIVQSGKENIGTLLWPEQEGEKKMSDKEYSDFLDSELEQYFLRLTSWPNLRVIAASRGMESLMVPRPGYPVVYSTDLIRRINMIARKLKDDLGYDYIVMDTPPSFTNIPGLSVMSADTITIAANPDGWNFSSIAEFCLINRQQVEAFMKQNVLEEGADVISTKLVITNFDSGHNDKTVVGDMEKLFKKNEYHKPYMLRSQCVKAAHENRLNIFELPVKHSEVFGTKASVSRAIENCEDLFMGIFKEGIEELWPSFSRLGHDGKKTGKNGKYPG